MSTVPVKVFTGRKLADSTSVPDALINYEVVEIPTEANDTYDSLVLKCARYCHILPLYIPLFGIWNPIKESWMKLSSDIDRSNGAASHSRDNALPECCLEFRVRYLVKSEMQIDGQKKISMRWSLPSEGIIRFLDETVTNYLYRQKREDFLSDKIKFIGNDSSDESVFSVALGVAALDLLCISKMVNYSIKRTRKKVRIGQLLSNEFHQKMKNYNFMNRKRVKTKFRHFLKYLSPSVENWLQNGRNLEYFQQRYLLNLELSSAGYGVEEYSLADGGFVTVSADDGIVICEDTSGNEGKVWCSFPELSDMTLQAPTTADTSRGAMTKSPSTSEPPITSHVVTIGKYNGEVKKLNMKSRSCAENLASCINGYYLLLVDAHHYICKDVTSPNLLEHLKLGCHRPISCAYAENLLRERAEKCLARIGDCIIRQSREMYDEYFVNTVYRVNPLEIRNYKLDRGNNRLLGLYGWTQSHRHEKLQGLLEACTGGQYQEQDIPIDPVNKVLPKPKHKSNLIVRLCSDQTDDVTHEDAAPKTNLIQLEVAESYREVSNLGNGTFTLVKRYAKHEDVDKYLVFKFILDQSEAQQNHHIHKSFHDATQMLNRLDHRHIVTQIGVTMSSVVGIWLEYLPHQSINTYLRTHQDLETPWFLQVLWQIAHACHYLEEKKFAHGNLCAKNVLLQHDAPKPLIKISDPGVRTRISSVKVDDRVEDSRSTVVKMPVLAAPWVAHEYCRVDTLPNCDKYPTIEGDKWSFATTACEIFNWGVMPKSSIFNAYELSEEMKIWYRRRDLVTCMHMSEVIRDNVELCNLLKRCWSIDPYKRPSFQQVLREIGSVLTGDYVRLRPEPCVLMEDTTPGIVDLPTFEDEKLTRIEKLGEGHFGFVGLFAYDRLRNGQRDLVAVKEPTKSTIKQQRDFMQEIETMKRVNHRYVVRLLGITEPSGRIVMEYLKNGSLAEYLKRLRANKEFMPTSVLLRFSSQIAEGMIALQEKRIVHRDLALRNILLGDDATNYHIKISDFGLSRFVKEEDNYYTGRLEEFPAHWYAPECLCTEGTRSFGFESDVWSYGVTIWEMFSHGDKPNYPPLQPIRYQHMLKQLYVHLKRGNRLAKTVLCPGKVYDILLQCWNFDKKERPSFEEIKGEFDNLIPYGKDLK